MVIAAVFFTPFTAAIQNRYFSVYYRSYDIVINYFTLFAGFRSIEKFSGRAERITAVLIICGSLYTGVCQYLNSEKIFSAGENYSRILKMEKDESDIVCRMKDIYEKSGKNQIKVISPIYQLRAEIPGVTTLYGRHGTFNGNDDENDLYSVFYIDLMTKDPEDVGTEDVEIIDSLLEKSEYEYVIIEKDQPYCYDSENDHYYFLYYILIDGHCSDVIYENSTYAIFEIYH